MTTLAEFFPKIGSVGLLILFTGTLQGRNKVRNRESDFHYPHLDSYLLPYFLISSLPHIKANATSSAKQEILGFLFLERTSCWRGKARKQFLNNSVLSCDNRLQLKGTLNLQLPLLMHVASPASCMG